VGLLITFEGCEGCGKSTQARKLYSHIRRLGVAVSMTREPGGTRLGNRIRTLLKGRGDLEISPLAELFLFLAARHQLVTEVLRHIGEREVVICDRYSDSSVAYQGYGRGLDLAVIQSVNAIATEGHVPDLVVLLDIPPDVGLARKGGATGDHFEQESLAFHRRVREGYLKMARQDPARWLVVDGTLPRKEAEVIIWRRVESLLARMPVSVV
jgi:dTMP kinase